MSADMQARIDAAARRTDIARTNLFHAIELDASDAVLDRLTQFYRDASDAELFARLAAMSSHQPNRAA